jgi:hypothetical protein
MTNLFRELQIHKLVPSSRVLKTSYATGPRFEYLRYPWPEHRGGSFSGAQRINCKPGYHMKSVRRLKHKSRRNWHEAKVIGGLIKNGGSGRNRKGKDDR